MKKRQVKKKPKNGGVTLEYLKKKREAEWKEINKRANKEEK